MNSATQLIKFAMPEINAGEIYAGAIIKPDGTGHHVIILPGDHKSANWVDSMEWAQNLGGDLPDRVEQALFYQHLPEHFQKDWYWSSTQHASHAEYAWCQDFSDGGQDHSYAGYELCARAVRRSVI